jgi:hypothetical protein
VYVPEDKFGTLQLIGINFQCFYHVCDGITILGNTGSNYAYLYSINVASHCAIYMDVASVAYPGFFFGGRFNKFG